MYVNLSRIMTLCAISLAAFSVRSIPTHASDFQSPRTAALGGAGHAGPMLNDSIYLNPSFASFLPAFSLATNYLFFKGADNGGTTSADPHGHALNFSLQDGRTELFQAGLGLTLMDDRRTFSFGAAKSFVRRFGVGIGGKWVLPNTSAPEAFWDSIFSTTFVPLEWLQLAAIIDNVVESGMSRNLGMYREYILGTKANIKGIVLLYFDPHLAPHAPEPFGHELGIEFPFFQSIFFRLGNFRNANVPWLNLRGSGYSSGLGWIGPRMSIDFALHRTLSPVLATTYNTGVTVYF